MNIYFRCLESRIDKNNTLYGKFHLTSIPSGQGNTFANALRRSLFSDLSGLAITHFCITSSPGLGYEFATIPGLAESVLDFSLNLKKVVLTGRLTGALSTCYKMDKNTSSQLPEDQDFDVFGYSLPVKQVSRDSEIIKSGTKSPVSSIQRLPFSLKNTFAKKGKVFSTRPLKESVVGKEGFSASLSPLKETKKSHVQNLSSLAPIGFIKAKGPTILRACDLILPPGIRCVHPDQYLGTLAADSALSIKFLIAAGKGYIVQDETFYKSLSRAKLLLASRGSFSTDGEARIALEKKKAKQAKQLYPVKSGLSFSPSLKASPATRVNSSILKPSVKQVVNLRFKHPFHKTKNFRYRCLSNIDNPFFAPLSYASWTDASCQSGKMRRFSEGLQSKDHPYVPAAPYDSPLMHKGPNYFKPMLIANQVKFTQEQPLARLNDNEKLSRKQLIWGAQDKIHPVLPLDATFTPISKVNFQIDIDRNRERSEETIVFEIWTNGSITPKRAIQESCLALAQDFYSLFSSVNGFSNLHSWWKRESIQFYPRHLS